MADIEDWFDTDLLDSVKETATWLSDYEHGDGDGLYWDVLPGKDIDPRGTLTSVTSLYGGAAGIALFFLRLYRVTGETSYLDKAKGGINYVIAHNDGAKTYEDAGEGTMRGIAAGLMNGPAGGGYVSYLLYEDTKDEKYLNYALDVSNTLLAAADSADDGSIYWSGNFGILSDGGLILYLIWIYEKTGREEYLLAAKKAGLFITAQAEEAPDGIRWYVMDTEAFGLGSHGFFPGFFYGTAGTGYILAKLYEHTKDELFLRQAEGAADYIRSIADLSKDRHAALVRYNDPYKPDLHYLGVCQGPIGTSRLFYQLYKVTGKPEYLEWIVKLTDGILKTGAPRIHSKGYWHTYCYCCGAAGMIEHFLSVYRLTGEDRFFAAAGAAVDTLLGDSVADDGRRCWYTAWNRHLPGEVEPWAGLYLGSAGSASSILSFYNFTNDDKEIGAYIEDPYNK